MRITVLGKSPSWPDAGGACSGYLVEEAGFALLLDCGTGVLAKLRARIDYTGIDAILVTHLHSDHFFDLIPFSYALTLSPRRPAEGWPRPLVWAPPRARAVFRATAGAWGKEDLIETAFDIHEYEPDAELGIGPFRARLREVPHYTQTFAVDLRGEHGRLTYGADCGPNEALVELARGTDLLITEATLAEPEDTDPRGHLTAGEAGELARAAGAGRLLVSHFSDELDPERVRAQAMAGFGGPVELAAEGLALEL